MHLIGFNYVIGTLKINGHFNLLFGGEAGKFFSKLLAHFARGLFFLLGLHGKHFTICETGNNVFLKHRNWSLFCLSMERHNSVPKRHPKASTEHKQCNMEKSKKVPTATNSIVYTNDVA